LEDDDEEIILEFKPVLTHKQRIAIGRSAETFMRRYFIDELKQEFCERSQYSSKFLDKCGIDFDNLPMRIQLKAGVQADMKPIKELIYIHKQCIMFIPPDSVWLTRLKVVIHHKTNSKGKKGDKANGFTNCYMTELDFMEFITLSGIHSSDVKFRIQKNKEPTGSEFDNMVIFNLATFTELFKKSFPPQLNPHKDDTPNKKRRGK